MYEYLYITGLCFKRDYNGAGLFLLVYENTQFPMK